MSSSGMLRLVALVRTDISEERVPFIFKVERAAGNSVSNQQLKQIVKEH
jgi:hypothetical protein